MSPALRRGLLAACIAGLAINSAALAQDGPRTGDGFTVAAATEMVARAKDLAAPEQRAELRMLCRAPGVRGRPREGSEPKAVRFAPTRVFDDLYYFGSTYVGATVIRTSAGLVLIDSLTTSEATAEELVAGMKTLGLEPAAIKYLILTHGHGDHYGGIPYLRAHYPGFRVIASEDDWTFLKKPSMKGGQPDPSPKEPRGARDMGYVGSYDLVVGDKIFHLIETPGHTPGTTSLLYNVKVGGQDQEVMQWGGGGPTDAQVADASFEAFAARAKALKASIRWGSHARPDWVERHLQVRPGSATELRLVEGSAKTALFLDAISLCRRANALQAAGSPFGLSRP